MSVVSSLKSQAIGEEFDHLIPHALSCTFESKDVSIMTYKGLKFESLDEMIKVEDWVCFDDCKGMPKEACLSGPSIVTRSSC